MTSCELSIVIPVYNEQEVLPELHRRLEKLLSDNRCPTSEVLFVSDGSTDETEDILSELVCQDSRFRAVLLARNFGHQAAVSVGLQMVRGRYVAVIDGDLQDPPEAILELLAALHNGADVAYGIRRKRKEGILKRTAYFVFYRLLNFVSPIDVPLDTGDFCCMRREVVDKINSLSERNRFVRGLRAWVGYTQIGVEYERQSRCAGRSKYTLRKLLALTYDGLFSFSRLPVRLAQWLGFGVSSLSFVVAFAYFVWYFLSPQPFPRGFATLTISIWFLGGVQLLFLGIIGEYVVRTLDETRRRPVAVVRSVLEQPPAKAVSGGTATDNPQLAELVS